MRDIYAFIVTIELLNNYRTINVKYRLLIYTFYQTKNILDYTATLVYNTSICVKIINIYNISEGSV